MPGLSGTADAFQRGAEIGQWRRDRKQQRTEQLADEERQTKVADLYGKGHDLAKLVPTLTGADREKAMQSLTDIETQIQQIYHPTKNPGAVQKDWEFLRGLITRKKQPAPLNVSYDATTTPDRTFTPPDQSVTLGATPGYQTPEALKTRAKLRTEQGTPEAAITLPSAPVTIPGTTRPSVRPAASIMTPQQRQTMRQRDAARGQAELDVATQGLTPEQEIQQESRKNLAYITQAVKDFQTLRPNATTEEKAAFFNDLVTKQYGFTQQKPVWRDYVAPDGTRQVFDASRPDLIPSGWTLLEKTQPSADTRKRADFEAYKKQNPEYTGSFEQWTVEQGQLARRAVPTGRDDRFIDIERRRGLGEQISKDDQAYSDAWNLYVNKRVLDPIRLRAAANAADRYVQVMDLNDPEKVVFMHAGEAARAGAGTPQSIGFKTDAAITKYMIAGPGGQNIGYFNTAVDHLGLLGEAADALNNGDTQAFNQWGNAFAQATGDAAPTNFDTVKSAVAGELGKTFKGTGATDQEISEINQTINSAMSPDQLHGAITYYTRLMGGKLNALRSQFEAGKAGRPAFPENMPPTRTPAPGAGAAPPAATGGAAAAGGKGPMSVAKAMQHWASQPDAAQKRFGTTKPSEQQVIEDIQKKGYTPMRP